MLTGRSLVITALATLVLIYSIVPPLRSSLTHTLLSGSSPANSTLPLPLTDQTSKKNTTNDLLVIYAYHETANALSTARFFLRHGLHARADFLFLVNGISQLEREIPKNLSNVSVRLRENVCYDLGSHGQVLGEDERALAKRYGRFVLLNSSIRGPFLPVWSRDCWTDVYADMITDVVKLGGMTFNCPGKHMNSMIYSTDQIGLNVMLDHCFSSCFQEMGQAVECEQGTTDHMLSQGYEIDVLMAAWHGEFPSGPNEYLSSCNNDDVNRENAYYGFNLHPYETLFMKANRGIAPEMMEHLTRWHDGMRPEGSWDVCERSWRERRGGSG